MFYISIFGSNSLHSTLSTFNTHSHTRAQHHQGSRAPLLTWHRYPLLLLVDVSQVMWGPSRHLGSLTAANWVSFDFNVSYFSCRGYSLINILKSKKIKKKLSLRFLSLSIASKNFWTLISILQHVVNSCTTSSSVCIPSGVSAKIEMSSKKLMWLN